MCSDPLPGSKRLAEQPAAQLGAVVGRPRAASPERPGQRLGERGGRQGRGADYVARTLVHKGLDASAHKSLHHQLGPAIGYRGNPQDGGQGSELMQPIGSG